jgi:hypothetical protein
MRAGCSTHGVRGVAGALGPALCLSLGACSNPLFPADEDRSQFQAYDRARGQTVPAFVQDEFGRKRPNLRGRLLVSD